MDFNQFVVNSMNWKKVAIIVVIAVLGLWIVQEIVFWHFMHEMQNMYAKFNTQFENDQQLIHNKIVEAENRQKTIKSEMDQFEERLHQNVNKTMDEAFRFQKNVADEIEKREERLQRAFAEWPKKWREESEKRVDEILKEFNRRSEEHRAELHREILRRDKEDKARELAWRKKREAEENKRWEIARKRLPI